MALNPFQWRNRQQIADIEKNNILFLFGADYDNSQIINLLIIWSIAKEQ